MQAVNQRGGLFSVRFADMWPQDAEEASMKLTWLRAPKTLP